MLEPVVAAAGSEGAMTMGGSAAAGEPGADAGEQIDWLTKRLGEEEAARKGLEAELRDAHEEQEELLMCLGEQDQLVQQLQALSSSFAQDCCLTMTK